MIATFPKNAGVESFAATTKKMNDDMMETIGMLAFFKKFKIGFIMKGFYHELLSFINVSFFSFASSTILSSVFTTFIISSGSAPLLIPNFMTSSLVLTRRTCESFLSFLSFSSLSSFCNLSSDSTISFMCFSFCVSCFTSSFLASLSFILPSSTFFKYRIIATRNAITIGTPFLCA
ncbi:hypothetical protein STSV1pORF28 [Sulfolobus virus STSV1]|uniref:hypothetical protein n=1 Tax=Sulfolobus virus STSV1 TaxID=285013 RepID=UPI000042B109|nr:hypothetical protein STSV1pORF28 [Sulfolobus virus STSV1]CAH04210.1 hypothetical protein [Sulfolobus virus STSV1]